MLLPASCVNFVAAENTLFQVRPRASIVQWGNTKKRKVGSLHIASFVQTALNTSIKNLAVIFVKLGNIKKAMTSWVWFAPAVEGVDSQFQHHNRVLAVMWGNFNRSLRQWITVATTAQLENGSSTRSPSVLCATQGSTRTKTKRHQRFVIFVKQESSLLQKMLFVIIVCLENIKRRTLLQWPHVSFVPLDLNLCRQL